MPTPPEITNAPEVVLVDSVSARPTVCPVTYNLPPMFTSLPMPAPPAITNAPVFVPVELVSFVVVKTSSVVTLVVVTVVYSITKRLETMVPPTYKSPPMPTPPATCNAPLDVEVAEVIPDTKILVAVMVDVVTRPLRSTISASIIKLVPVADIFTKVPVFSNDKESPSLTEPIDSVSAVPVEVFITRPPPAGSTERVVPPKSIVCPATYSLPNRLVGEPRSCRPSVSGINLKPVLSVTVLVWSVVNPSPKLPV